MSDEYANTGTVRRRPRADHQRSQTHRQNGKGEYGANGHSRADMDEEEFEWDEKEEEGERRAWESERENPRSSRQRRPWEEPEPRKALTYNESAEEAPGFKLPFDPWRLVAAVKRNSGMICVGTLIAALAGFALAA